MILVLALMLFLLLLGSVKVASWSAHLVERVVQGRSKQPGKLSVTTQCCLWVKSNPKNVSSEREPQNTYFRLLNRQPRCFFWKSRFLLDGHRLALQNWTWEFWKISAENHIRWELEKDKRFGACDARVTPGRAKTPHEWVEPEESTKFPSTTHKKAPDLNHTIASQLFVTILHRINFCWHQSTQCW